MGKAGKKSVTNKKGKTSITRNPKFAKTKSLKVESKVVENEIAYQNKDILSKVLAENFKDKSLGVYGVDVPRIKAVLPTNLPAIQANEMRIDNLFLLEDGSVAVIDYESDVNWENNLKYLNYIARVLKRYKKSTVPKKIRMIVIYTADVERADAEFSVGCLTLKLEQAFLSQIDAEEVAGRIWWKLENGEALTDEELMKFIILPLTYKGKERKKQAVKDAVELAKKIPKEEGKTFVLSGILVFADKIIDAATANYIKEVISMTQVAQLLMEEGREEGREEGIVLSAEIFRIVKENPNISNDKVAENVGCEVEQVKSVRRIFSM